MSFPHTLLSHAKQQYLYIEGDYTILFMLQTIYNSKYIFIQKLFFPKFFF